MGFTYLEFFAGGGLAGHGLSKGWRRLFANDLDPKKAAAFCANNDSGPFRLGDIASLGAHDLPGAADLAWASFPCQDLSLAGTGRGLSGARSGTFWAFWRLMEGLAREERGPKIVALENVCGAITSHGGRDLEAIAEAFRALGYRFRACVIDAAHFTPQSRPRLFIVGLRYDLVEPEGLVARAPAAVWHPRALCESLARFAPKTRANAALLDPGGAPRRNLGLADLIEDEPEGVAWNSYVRTRYLLSLMDETNRAKVRAAQQEGIRRVGAVYRRTRPDGDGGRVQRAEARFDDMAGCLRTPAGGSSRQTILVVEGRRVRSRLLSPREAARLMGLSDDFVLPARYNDAYHLLGDGVAAPVVRFLAERVFEPALTGSPRALAA